VGLNIGDCCSYAVPRHAGLPRFPAGDSFAQNEVLLLLNVLAYGIVHAVRVMLGAGTSEGWSMKRVRERVLRVAALILGAAARRATDLADGW